MPGVNSSKSEAPDSADLRVSYTGGPTKVRKSYAISGISPGIQFLTYNNTILGMERAIKERLLFVHVDGKWQEPPFPSFGVVEDRLRNFRTQLSKHVNVCHPLSRKNFSCLFHGRKLVRYQRAIGKLGVEGLLRSDGDLKYFMKYEAYDFESKTNPAPRGINPRSDKYLVEMGRYIRPLEKKIYKDLCSVYGYEVVMKGKNQSERGNILKTYWDHFRDPVCVMGDASRFEQSVGVQMLQFEHGVYQQYYPNDKLFKRMCSWQLRSKGKARCSDGKLSFSIEGRRASGDPNTALGNCLDSAGLAYAYLEEIGISEHRVFLDGDDIGFIMERSDISKFSEGNKAWYLEMGFRMKFEKVVDIFEEIDFCKSRPVAVKEGYMMARAPIAGHSKDSLCKINLQSESLTKRWYSAVGQGGLAAMGGIPISQSFYDAFSRAACGAEPLRLMDTWNLENKYKDMKRGFMEIIPETRHSYWKAYGITPDAQIALESELDSLDLSTVPRKGRAHTLRHLCWES